MLTQVVLLYLAASMAAATSYDYSSGKSYGYAPKKSYGYSGYQGAYAQPAEVYDSYHKPQPYSFGYETKDAYGNKQFRQEDSDASGAKRGSYGYTDAHGIYRTVEYVADHKGFRAWIKTNEPGTSNQDPADVKVNAVESPVHHSPVLAPASPAVYSSPVHYDSYSPKAYKAPAYYGDAYGSSPQVYKVPSYGYKPHYRKYDDVY
uniref:U84-Liphistoxin-Lth1a_1 n=1 Tax=Liphistius thaleban TaxID=1905330 RepID=A0A4Q8K3I7_9ARAC